MSKGWPWNNLREVHSPFPPPHPTELLGGSLHPLWVHVPFLQSTGLECTYQSIYPCVCLITVYSASLRSMGAGIGYDFSDCWVFSTWCSIWPEVNTKWTKTSVNELALYLRVISVTVIMHLLLFALLPCNSTHSLTLLKIVTLGIYIHTYTHMYTYYIQMYIYIFAYVCVMYTHVYIYVHIYVCGGMLYIHTHLCVCERVCISGKIIEKMPNWEIYAVNMTVC